MKQQDYFMKKVTFNKRYDSNIYVSIKYKDNIILTTEPIPLNQDDHSSYKKCMYEVVSGEGIIIGQSNKQEGFLERYSDYEDFSIYEHVSYTFRVEKVIRFWKVLIGFDKVILVPKYDSNTKILDLIEEITR